MASQLSLLFLAGLDISGGSTLRPFLGIIAEQLGASPLEIGFFLSLYGVFQIIFGPIIGNASDKMGRKTLLQLSFLFSAMTPFLILIINTLQLHHYCLCLAIIPMAVFRHAQACVKSIMIDQSQHEHKKQNETFGLMAKWSCSCYIGSTLGPLLVSLFSNNKSSINTVCMVSICFFLISLFIATMFITESHSPDQQSKVQIKSSPFSMDISIFKFPNKQIKQLILYHFVAYFALHLYRSSFVLILNHRFHLEMHSVAKILTFEGVIGFLIQLYLTQHHRLKNKHNLMEYNMLIRSTLCLGLSMASYGLIGENVHYLFIILVFERIGESTFRTSFQTVFANKVAKLHSNSTQTYIGLIDSLSNFNRSVTPIIFGVIPDPTRYYLTPIIAGCLDLFLYFTQRPDVQRVKVSGSESISRSPFSSSSTSSASSSIIH